MNSRQSIDGTRWKVGVNCSVCIVLNLILLYLCTIYVEAPVPRRRRDERDLQDDVFFFRNAAPDVVGNER